ncbi:MAG: carboxypeptidase regulatory-like domain-containing protein, partial [Candidatus Rokuibacteriota bacterium]
GAVVEITATGMATQSAVDGRYSLTGVPPGPVTLFIRKIGHRPKTVVGLQVPDGGAVEQDVALPVEVFELESITVSAVQERGTVAEALSEQRRATGIINAVTAEQITRSPDSDAGQAVQRVSGVSVQDGRYVLVRGLGERYTTTSLNSARLPSPEPERKIVPLDLFPSGLLQSIVTSKTFTPDQPGDFTGAQVDLRTREFPLHRALTLSASVGYSDAVTGQTVLRAPATGTEWLGFAGAERQLPAVARDAGDLSGLTQADLNDIIASFRHVWSPARRDAPPNASFGVSLGGEDPILGHPVGYIASLTYSLDQEIRRDEERAIAISGGVADSTLPQNVRRGTTGGTSVLWGGMANLTTRLGAYSKLSFNNTYTRGAENLATQLAGFFEEDARDFVVARLDFVER